MKLSNRLLCALGLREFYKIIHNGTGKFSTPCYGKYSIYKYCPWNGCYLLVNPVLNDWRFERFAIQMIVTLERGKFSPLRKIFDWKVTVKTSGLTGK